MKEPELSVQPALASQLCDGRVYSLILEHEMPEPVNPTLQPHVNEPAMFWQLAFA